MADLKMAEVATALERARSAQPAWGSTPPRERLGVLRGLRERLASAPERVMPAGVPSQFLAGEVLPLCAACRFLEREAESILSPRHLGGRGRPIWLWGVTSEVRREPLGVILIIAPGNYPLMLPGIQLVQALAAGNAVAVKPAPGCSGPLRHLLEGLRAAGLPAGLVQLLPESPAVVAAALGAGIDKIILTGSARTGEAVLELAARHLVPVVAELSGCDACFVRADADLDRVVAALTFACNWNAGATCIAPRRVLVQHTRAQELERRLRAAGLEVVAQIPPDEEGAFTSHLALTAVRDDEEALNLAAQCPYALGATIFGAESGARRLAERVRAGVVLINDVIVPTADPRLPFGGRRRSGFGLTRGPEGLLEMTAVKVVAVRRGACRHLDPPRPDDADLFRHYLQASHGRGWWQRLLGWLRLARVLTSRLVCSG